MQHRKNIVDTDQNALAELYQRHVYALLYYIRRYVPVREDAEDLLLEVFLATLDRGALVTLSADEQLAWLRRVAYNKCVDFLRRQQRYPQVELGSVVETMLAPDEHSPEVAAMRSEEHALLWQHMASLSSYQQTIVHLKFGRNLSGKEIARQLNKSEGNVSMLLARALNRLRELYGVKAGKKKGDHPHEA